MSLVIMLNAGPPGAQRNTVSLTIAHQSRTRRPMDVLPYSPVTVDWSNSVLRNRVRSKWSQSQPGSQKDWTSAWVLSLQYEMPSRLHENHRGHSNDQWQCKNSNVWIDRKHTACCDVWEIHCNNIYYYIGLYIIIAVGQRLVVVWIHAVWLQ